MTDQANRNMGKKRLPKAWLAGILLGVSLGSAAGILYLSSPPSPAEPFAGQVTVYKSPECGCCTMWEDHMRANGFRVVSHVSSDMSRIKDEQAIPREAASCHTALIDGYVIEGHVPAESIRRLLRERPKDVRGLAVPGMPMGSPGMEGPYAEAYDVIALGADHQPPRVFDRYE